MCLVKKFLFKFDLRTGMFIIGGVRSTLWALVFLTSLLLPEDQNWFKENGLQFYFAVLIILELVLVIGAYFRKKLVVFIWFCSPLISFCLACVGATDSFSEISSNVQIKAAVKALLTLIIGFDVFSAFHVVSFMFKMRDEVGVVIEQHRPGIGYIQTPQGRDPRPPPPEPQYNQTSSSHESYYPQGPPPAYNESFKESPFTPQPSAPTAPKEEDLY